MRQKEALRDLEQYKQKDVRNMLCFLIKLKIYYPYQMEKEEFRDRGSGERKLQVRLGDII